MKKIKKFFKNPGMFFRDYLIKKYPYINNEQQCPEQDEIAILKHAQLLEKDYLKLSTENPIDLVYTWINKNECWYSDYRECSVRISEHEIGQYANDSARFEDHNELFYSLKSVAQNMPWVRKIFIVTNSALDLPEYLISEKIVVVEHKDIIATQFLPTFNSHVIEANLHNIVDLSENFIYFNDDVFVGRELAKEHFFQSNGIASLFVSQKDLDKMYDKGTHTPTLLASLYSRDLLKEHFGCHVNQPLVHTYVPLKKSAYMLAWELYEKEILGFLGNKFRSNHDLNIATFLVPWLMYITGQSSIQTEICYYFNIRSPHAIQQYKKLIQRVDSEKPHSICANDFTSDANALTDYSYKKKFSEFLSHYF